VILKIYTFGSFSIACGDQMISTITTRNSRMWSAMKYLVAYRGKPVPVERLADTLWQDDDCPDPAKSVKDIIYRLRKALSASGGDEAYILSNPGSYCWNPDLPCYIDFTDFEKLLAFARDAGENPDERILCYNRAIDLYKGAFLGDSDSELWALSFVNHYKRLYLQAVEELADIYAQRYSLEEIILLYDKAIAIEPSEEALYIRQIQVLIQNGEYALARRQYRHIERILMREFDVKPSKVLQNLLNEINVASSGKTDDLDDIKKRFDQGSALKGALICGPETFRQIYCYDKRSEDRIEFPVFFVVMGLTINLKEDNNEESLKAAMKVLRQIMLRTLRRGDIVSQYSSNQFLLMLTTDNNMGGHAAMNRIKRLFEKEYGENTATLTIQMSPLGSRIEEGMTAS